MPYKKLEKANKELFEREIKDMKSQVLQKEHEITKLSVNKEGIQKSLLMAIEREKNIILAANANCVDYRYDHDHQVSFSALDVKIDQANHEIKRIKNNVKVREEQIQKGVLVNPTRDEKAREDIKKKCHK